MKNENILFFYQISSFSFTKRNKLKNFMRNLCRKEKKSINEIRIIFSDRKAMRTINKKFLSHDYDTDIITFPFSNDNMPLEAELYINIPILKKQAKDYNSSFKEELHRVIFHGLLHLCGYNDKTPEEINEIRKKENYYLQKYLGK
ncbi:MAG: rRNA maturation RNase YbeY [Bacteroidota bacterium]|jgi:probable rRNA maturation factor